MKWVLWIACGITLKPDKLDTFLCCMLLLYVGSFLSKSGQITYLKSGLFHVAVVIALALEAFVHIVPIGAETSFLN